MTKQNSKLTILVIVIIIVLGIIGYYLTTQNGSKEALETSTTTPISIQVPLNPKDFFTGETVFHKLLTFTNSMTHAVVSLQLLTGTQYQSTNPSFNILVNGKIAGESGGEGISLATFSPNNMYFAFRSRHDSGCNGSCQDHTLTVVNLSQPSIVPIILPALKEGDAINMNHEYQSIESFVESYSWESTNTIDVTLYPVGVAKDGFYRIAPKEVWSFDLKTGKGNLLRTLPE